ncbi:hypothetical protein PFICI_01565 [Pestalotiopsis fici W106-1]|uniref:BUB protein kinase n=1 Tax=Pestalotiopsis fici (strain W106-1 / CGMCC3.15140) TaxID=1229662 RepID=W3XQF8_PESFW|nr:uncharacterized protein PFICI_01565 [Pestalotiopsis fici W106-1]ETS87737.1 hypothetical protein PFICI_01565 [Pestalotiopsis fici W106-1]
MAPSDDPVNFDVIEGQKENIQSLPGGRSAKKLAQLYSPTPLQQIPTPTDIKDANEHTRAKYEAEITTLADSDDPLDVFDRYVKWTFDAYPSAQATPQSQLHTLLERATKSFIGSTQYKNDPRYLKLWLHYIHFFSDTPRETFIFLSRHGIGEGLALFYEEYAAWLEGAGRWSQAEEVYKLGIEREARPTARLLRKFNEFEQRLAAQPDAGDAPSSPALPAMRPALAAKVDPFASARAADPQAPRTTAGVGGSTSKPSKSKLAIFSDADAAPPAPSPMGSGSKGWDTIGSLADRKKENKMEPKPWAGETLKAGGKKSSAPKMAIFRDASLARIAESHIVIAPSKHQVIINPANGRRERVYINLEAIYPTPEEPGTELSFEEIWASKRGWLDCSWEEYETEDNDFENEQESIVENAQTNALNQRLATKLVVHHDVVELDENGALKQQQKPSKPKKKKMMEVNETQIIKAKLDSPPKPKMRKNKSSEPTMTLHTRAATDEIYDLFNAPLQPADGEDQSEDDDEYVSDGDYTSGGESTCTTRQIATSEAGDDDEADDVNMEDRDGEDTVSDLLGPDDDDHTQERRNLSTPTDDDDDDDPRTMTRFVPIPPEDYVPNSRPYRDASEVANNRLPFMTPITERTESSLGFTTAAIAKYATTPASHNILEEDEEDEEDDEDFGPLSSPLREILGGNRSPVKIAQPKLHRPAGKHSAPSVAKGPLIAELQCNPVDEAIRQEILRVMHPPLASYSGFFDHRDARCNRGGEIRRFSKACAKANKPGNSDRNSISNPIVLEFPEVKSTYTLKRELGAGAYAPVYLVENSCPGQDHDDEAAPVEMGKGAFATSQRSAQEALKMEVPPTAWEFHMMRLAATRLGPQHRATASISAAHELHLYQDEGFLFLQYHPYGTLLDVVNFFREQPSGIMDEPLAMFFTIELLRTVEAMHSKQILHGDLKADNCLLRLDALSSEHNLSSQWQADGSGGWDARGVVLIDFGRGIDMRAFDPDVQFIADWKTTTTDCAEMREGRPWTWQIDYHGLAGIIHCLLFGRYIETVRCDQGGLGTTAGRRYKIRESLKRYWQTDLWAGCFDLLLNPGSYVEHEDGARMPVNKSLRSVREQMEAWLTANCEKGLGLKALMVRVEGFASARSRK